MILFVAKSIAFKFVKCCKCSLFLTFEIVGVFKKNSGDSCILWVTTPGSNPECSKYNFFSTNTNKNIILNQYANPNMKVISKVF